MKIQQFENQGGEQGGLLTGSRASLTAKQYVVPFILITTLFFLWGFARAILDVLNKHFQNEFSISITQSSFIQVTTYLGYFLMAIPAGIFINKYGYRKGVVFGLLLFGIGALLFIPGSASGTFNAFLGALFVIGCGLVFLETSANPYVTELGDKSTATSRLNLSQSFNGLGSLFATFVVGQFLFGNSIDGGDVAVPYTILGVLVLMIAAVFAKVRLPEINHGEEPASGGGLLSDIRGLWQHKVFVFGLIALLAYEVSEISINSYFINFVTGQGWMDDSVAAVVLTCALAFFMVGRFLGSWIMRYVRPERMLFICAVGSVSCLSLVLLDIRIVSLVALIGNYLFEAIMFPTIFSLALTGLGRLTKSASSLLMMTPIGGCGFLLMGLIADNVSIVAPFLVPLDGFIIVLLYAYKLLKHSCKSEE